MTRKLGENIQREWDSAPLAPEVWDALQLFDSDPPSAFAHLTELAERGSALAMLYLGAAYLQRRGGTARDAKLGEYWTERSARAGSIEGAFGLACHHEASGRFAEAEAELLTLADRGYSPAMFVLGYKYYQGSWRQQDVAKAVRYLSMAEAAGNLHATHWLSSIYWRERLGLAAKMKGCWKRLKLVLPWIKYCVSYPTSDRLRLSANPNQIAEKMERCLEGAARN